MTIDPYELRPARVQTPKYIGTSAAENDSNSLAIELHKLVGLDTKRWSILAFEMREGTERNGDGEVTVYAIDRITHGLDGAAHERMMELAEERGDLPVTLFRVEGVRPADITQRAMKRYTVQLRAAHIGDTPLTVEASEEITSA